MSRTFLHRHAHPHLIDVDASDRSRRTSGELLNTADGGRLAREDRGGLPSVCTRAHSRSDSPQHEAADRRFRRLIDDPERWRCSPPSARSSPFWPARRTNDDEANGVCRSRSRQERTPRDGARRVSPPLRPRAAAANGPRAATCGSTHQACPATGRRPTWHQRLRVPREVDPHAAMQGVRHADTDSAR